MLEVLAFGHCTDAISFNLTRLTIPMPKACQESVFGKDKEIGSREY